MAASATAAGRRHGCRVRGFSVSNRKPTRDAERGGGQRIQDREAGSIPTKDLLKGKGRGICAAATATLLALVPAGVASAHKAQDHGSKRTAMHGTLYFTRFMVTASDGPVPQFMPYGQVNDPSNVMKVHYQIGGSGLVLGTPRNVATLPAADGIAWAPNHKLLIGGQSSGTVYEVNPKTGSAQAQPAGIKNAYMVGLSPHSGTAYFGSVGNPTTNAIGVVPLKPFGPGTQLPVSSNVDAIAFDNGTAYYTNSNTGGMGSFGTINLQTGHKSHLLSDVPAHGMTYDPYTGDLMLFGGKEIAQYSPTAGKIVSTLTVKSLTSSVTSSLTFTVFDQGWVNGRGQLFAAANSGQLVYVNYAQSGLVGTSTHSQTFLKSYLDDVVGTPVSAASMPTACPGSEPDKQGDKRSDNHHGKGEDGLQNKSGAEAKQADHGKGRCGDPDRQGDKSSDNHHGKGEDSTSTHKG